MTPDQLMRQIQQGDGNMPAFGRNLDSAQMTALVSFLTTLKPEFEAPARIPGAQLPLPVRRMPGEVATPVAAGPQ